MIMYKLGVQHGSDPIRSARIIGADVAATMNENMMIIHVQYL